MTVRCAHRSSRDECVTGARPSVTSPATAPCRGPRKGPTSGGISRVVSQATEGGPEEPRVPGQPLSDHEIWTVGVMIHLLCFVRPAVVEKKDLIEYMLSSVAPSTRKAYCAYIGRFFDFCDGRGNVKAKFGALNILDFLHVMGMQGSGWPSMQTALSALRWLMNILGLPDGAKHPTYSLIIQGLRRKYSSAVSRKCPVGAEILQKLSTMLGNSNLADHRDLVIYLFSFSGFFRSAEVLALRVGDISISDDKSHLTVQLSQSKTDRFRSGSTVLIASNDLPVCPVKEFFRYIGRIYGPNPLSTLPVFPGMVRTAMGTYRVGIKPLSYSGYRVRLKRHLACVGLDPNRYGTHSFRSGGATAGNQLGIDRRLLMQHGRWVSDKSFDGYLEDTLRKKLSVSSKVFEKVQQ